MNRRGGRRKVGGLKIATSAPAKADLGLVCDHVHIDNVAAAREAVEHLIAAGRRRIAAIGWQDPSPRATAQQRMAGYRQAGPRVPRDIALVGFDDVEEAEYAIPSLTTVAPDKTGIAEAAVDALLRRIADGYAEPGRLIQPGNRLVLRESSGE